MPDLNFDELRAAVEEETFLPEFVEIRRRARRHRRWRVLVNAARLIGVLIIATPAFAVGDVVFTHIYNPQATHREDGSAKTDSDLGTDGREPSPLTDIAAQTILAVDGIDANHIYALEDICFGKNCDLELTLVNPTAADPSSPAVGLLRTKPTDRLLDPRLVLESTSLALVSAVVNAGARISWPVSLDPGTGAVGTVLRPLQTVFQGPIQYMGNGIQNTAEQPAVNQPVLTSDQGGWWVCGISSDNDLAVSVSHNEGATWHTTSTGIPLDGVMPNGITGAALATSDGANVYVLVRSYNQTTLSRSTDGGLTWHSIAASMVWPDSTAYNLVVTKDGTLIASFTGPSTSYFVSKDGGATFGPMDTEPVGGGLIVYAGGEFMTLGTIPSISQDGVNWQAAYVPYITTQPLTPTN